MSCKYLLLNCLGISFTQWTIHNLNVRYFPQVPQTKPHLILNLSFPFPNWSHLSPNSVFIHLLKSETWNLLSILFFTHIWKLWKCFFDPVSNLLILPPLCTSLAQVTLPQAVAVPSLLFFWPLVCPNPSEHCSQKSSTNMKIRTDHLPSQNYVHYIWISYYT